jgi:hypothetical protein
MAPRSLLPEETALGFHTAAASGSLSTAAGRIPSVGFVACIEPGILAAQALLLFDSIRRHAGRFSDAAIYALSPRAGRTISASTRAALDSLGVQYIDERLNLECPDYGSANRVAAAAYVERTTRHDVLVILDSDTLFLREPAELFLPDAVDVCLRPVDLKGMCTTGPDDAFDGYWRALCATTEVSYDTIPWIESFVDCRRIKASYNAGLVVARANLGIMERWADYFFASIRRGLYPNTHPGGFRAGAGWVYPGIGRYWGSNQAALSLAIWSTTRRVRDLAPTYNYPLHLHDRILGNGHRETFRNLVHVHYHWLFSSDAVIAHDLFAPAGPLTAVQRAWLERVLPLG